jgi:hypothetical protein
MECNFASRLINFIQYEKCKIYIFVGVYFVACFYSNTSGLDILIWWRIRLYWFDKICFTVKHFFDRSRHIPELVKKYNYYILKRFLVWYLSFCECVINRTFAYKKLLLTIASVKITGVRPHSWKDKDSIWFVIKEWLVRSLAEAKFLSDNWSWILSIMVISLIPLIQISFRICSRSLWRNW